MTSISDLHGSDLGIGLRHKRVQLRGWLFKRGRPVLPSYEPDRATWWALLRRSLLLMALIPVFVFYGLLTAILPPAFLVPAAGPPVILALFVIWALPEAPSPPVRAMRMMCLIFTGVVILWPNYLAISVGGLPWIALRRVIGAVAVLVLLICVSSSTKFRSETANVLRTSPWITRMMLGLIVAEVMSVVTSLSFGETLNRLVDVEILWTGVFFMAVWAFGSDRIPPIRWANMLLWCAGILMVIGAIEYKSEHVLWANHIPSFLRIQDDVVEMALTPHFRDRYRVLTTYTTPLAYAEFLGMITPLVLHKLANAKSLKGISLWALVDLGVLISAFFSGSRLGMVSYLVAHVAYFFLWAARRWRMQPGGLFGISATLLYPAAAMVLFIAVTTVPAIHNRVLGGGATQSSNDARHEQFVLAVPAIAKRPLFGYGPGEGAAAIGWRDQSGFLSIDSGYLSMAADFGLVGLVCFFGAIILAAVQTAISGLVAPGGGYPLRLAAATVLVTILTAKSVLSQADNNSLVLMFVAFAMALLYRAKKEENTSYKDLFRSAKPYPH